jgi:hypothetical protein
VDFEGDVLVTHNPASSSPTWTDAELDPGHALLSVSCTSAMVCGAVDEYGRFLSTTDAGDPAPAWSAPTSVDGRESLLAVSCAGSSLCMVGDEIGRALSGTVPPTVTPLPTTTTPAPKATPAPTPKHAAPSCTLTPASSKVLLSAKHHRHGHVGVLTLKARCTQLVLATLSGKVTVAKGRKHKSYPFATAHESLRASRTVTFTLKLPSRALSALAHHGKESATFKLSFYDAYGTSSATAKIAALKPQS